MGGGGGGEVLPARLAKHSRPKNTSKLCLFQLYGVVDVLLKKVLKNYLELPPNRRGLKMTFFRKITTIGCRIDISDCNHLSNSLFFRPILPNGRTF